MAKTSIASLLARLLLSRLRTARAVARWAWRMHARRLALVDRRGSWTYAELHARVLRLHGWLLDRDVPPGAVVFTWLPETGEQYETRLATLESGHVFASFHSRLPGSFALDMIERVRPAVFIHDPALSAPILAEVRRRWPDMHLLAIGAGYESALAASAPRRGTHPVHEDDLFALHMTSGTTGAPKAVGYTHRKYLNGVRSIARAVDFRRPPNGQDINLLGLPLTGPGSGLVLPTLLAGAALVMPERFDAGTLATLIERHRVTRAFLSPSAIIDLLDLPDIDRHDLSSLRLIPYGAEMMPAAKIAEAIRRFGPIFQQGYGSLEALPPITWLLPHEHVGPDGQPLGPEVLATVGTVVPGVDVVIRDDDFQPLPDGTTGLVTVRTASGFDGYWKDAEKTAHTLRDGWVVIGDHGFLDAAGRLHVLGRAADRVRRGDLWIYPREVEEVAHTHAAVKEACLVQNGGRAVLVASLRAAWRAGSPDAVRERHALLAADLLTHLQQRLPAALWPDDVRLTTELPRSFLNKMLRREVRDALQAESADDPSRLLALQGAPT